MLIGGCFFNCPRPDAARSLAIPLTDKQVKNMDYFQALEYLAAKATEISVRDKTDGRNKGIK